MYDQATINVTAHQAKSDEVLHSLNNFEKTSYHRVDEHTFIRTVHFSNRDGAHERNLIIVSGWISEVTHFRKILDIYTATRHVILLETREKTSSIISPKSDFKYATMVSDVEKVINNLSSICANYELIGLSLGANILLDAYQNLCVKPQSLILMAPSVTIKAKNWHFALALLPHKTLIILRAILKWYFDIKGKPKDKDLRNIFLDSLERIDTYKIRKNMLALFKLKLITKPLTSIDCPTQLFAAENDTYHNEADARWIAMQIKDCDYQVMNSFSKSFSPEIARIQIAFLNVHNVAD